MWISEKQFGLKLLFWIYLRIWIYFGFIRVIFYFDNLTEQYQAKYVKEEGN